MEVHEKQPSTTIFESDIFQDAVSEFRIIIYIYIYTVYVIMLGFASIFVFGSYIELVVETYTYRPKSALNTTGMYLSP